MRIVDWFYGTALIGACLLCGCSSDEVPPPGVPVVAVDPFGNRSQASSREIEVLQNRLQQALGGSRKFRVVSYDRLEDFVKARRKTFWWRAKGEVVKSIPPEEKFYILRCTVAGYGCERRKSGSGKGEVSRIKHAVDMQLKLFDAEAPEAAGPVDQVFLTVEETPTQTRVADRHGKSAGGGEELVRETVRQVVGTVCEMASCPATIIACDGEEVSIDLTEAVAGAGDVFDVLRVEKASHEQSAKGRVDGRKVGRIKVTEADDRSVTAVATFSEGQAGPKLDLKQIKDDKSGVYRVRRVPQARLCAERCGDVKEKRGGASAADNF